MPISRELALNIIKFLLDNPTFNFPFLVMCKGYASYDDNDEDFVEIVPKDDYENLVDDISYDTFELWEHLNNLDAITLELMAKGFIDKILSEKEIFIDTKDFIFITFEGMTFQPNSESIMPDIENMQVIGFSKGYDSKNAFENLKIKSPYLARTTFNEIIAIELKSKQFEYFNLK